MRSVNPATGEETESYAEHTEDDVRVLVGQAQEAFRVWRARDISERQRIVETAGGILRDNKETYAALMTREIGKPIRSAEAEVEKCAWLCDYYAERADEHLQHELIGTGPGSTAYVRYDPIGPVLAVMPWNYPFWQVFRFAVPNLCAGNVGLLKHASNVPGTALAIEDVFREAGAPDGVFTTLMIGSGKVDGVIRDPRVRGVTLTGSTPAGRAVAETAGRHLKKTVLELGGSDPFIVLENADLEKAARTGARARNLNSGQSCIAAKRFIVLNDVYDDFLPLLVEETESLVIGDPMDPETDVGPLAREDLLDTLHEQVQQSVDAGAEVVTGGIRLDREGCFYAPTVLCNIPKGCPASDDELFGPVASVFRVEDEEEALRMANDTPFGLGASIWTRDPDRGERLARDLDAGMVFINSLVKSDPRLPFGGVKDSGYGRELSRHGIREFTNAKTVWVNRG